MAPFFELVYASAIFLVAALAGFVPGWVLGLALPGRRKELLLAAAAVAIAIWIWTGWLGPRYGISRAGLVLFAAVLAAGLVCGWRFGLEAGAALRRRARRR